MEQDEQKANPLNFFRSRTRVKLLVQFMLSSKERFYMRELERILKVSIGNIRRELINLEKAGVLKSEKVGNIKFYSLDKDSPIYNSLRDIVVKTVGIPKLLGSCIIPNQNILISFIYGSYAKGNLDNESDIDLFVIAKKNNRVFEEISDRIDRLSERFGREINVDILLEKEFQEKLKNEDTYIHDLINGKLIFIKGGENELRLFETKKTAS